MEELCVKMSMLSLSADSKMEAYDAKLEQFFYEEKDEVKDNSRDDKNDETFEYNDDTHYSLEVCAFNTRYGSNLNTEKLEIFKDYIEDKGLKVLDGIDYIQGCHNCDKQLDTFGNEYCNKRCCESVEVYRYPCARGNECLICHGYPETTCYWAYNGCDRCDAYDGPEEERYPISCFNCEKQMTDHEGYLVDDEHYCNLCVVDVFDCAEHLEEEVDDDSNDSRKRDRESDDDDDESESKRQRVNEKNTRDMMSKLTYESCDIWELALDINHGDKEAALQMIEDQERLRAHPRVIEYYHAKNQDNEECSSESSEESSQDDDLQHRKRARISLDDAFELDISDVESNEDFVIDLLDDDAMVIDLVSDDDDDNNGFSNNKERNWVFRRFIDRNEDDASEEEDNASEEDDNASEEDDYAESVVDDDGVVEMEEEALPNQHFYNVMHQMEQEILALKLELYAMRTQRQMLFPEGSSISITIEGGQRYINIHDAIPPANNSPMTLDELDGDDDESSCGEEEDNMDYLDMDESV
jgi:hypothetical protein